MARAAAYTALVALLGAGPSGVSAQGKVNATPDTASLGDPIYKDASPDATCVAFGDALGASWRVGVDNAATVDDAFPWGAEGSGASLHVAMAAPGAAVEVRNPHLGVFV